MKRKSLYHQAKGGSIVQWTIWTVGPKIHTEYGQMGGKMQEATRLAKSKNVGRSNETSPVEQAELEAESMYKNKLDRKYSKTLKAAKSPVFLPMLAHNFEKCKKKVVYPADVQPKLDGFRFIAKWEGNSVVMRTRSGKVVKIAHIQADLARVLPKHTAADGEVYIHGTTFQHVAKLIKKYRPGETEKLKFWIYDMFETKAPNTPWSKRKILFRNLGGIQQSGPGAGLHTLITPPIDSLMLVTSQPVSTEQEVYNWQEFFVSRGYEGAILRHLAAPYELGHRSRNLLKVKSFKDEEYKIVGYKSGRGKCADCVTWVCDLGDGTTFHVVPKASLEDKRKWLREGDKYIGKMLKVKYFEKSEDHVPRFPVGLGIRDIT